MCGGVCMFVFVYFHLFLSSPSALIKYIRPVFVSRSDQDSRRKTVEEIKRRAHSEGVWPQVEWWVFDHTHSKATEMYHKALKRSFGFVKRCTRWNRNSVRCCCFFLLKKKEDILVLNLFHFSYGLSQIMIFPEGTCTNRSCLITFKPGVCVCACTRVFALQLMYDTCTLPSSCNCRLTIACVLILSVRLKRARVLTNRK